MLKKLSLVLMVLLWFSCSKENNNDSGNKVYVSKSTEEPTSANIVKNTPQVSALPYKHYAALLTQSGTGNPTATILYNDIGVNISWARNSIGFYIGTPSSNWPHGTTICTIQNIGIQYSVGCFMTSIPINQENVYVFTGLIGTIATADGVLDKSFVEVRVYP